MIRLAINGYGRIGRCLLRALYEGGYRDQMAVVAINEPADLATIAHLAKYDSTHGRFPGDIDARPAAGAGEAGVLQVNGDAIAVTHIEALAEGPWAGHGIDVVLECSGLYRSAEALQCHLDRGARRVLLSQPGDPDLKAIVCGVNDSAIAADDRILCAASCTSNGIVPVINLLHRAFTVKAGVITTIHSAMHDQPVIDAYHHTDLRKTRAAGQSIIPIETELAAGVGRILPALDGRFAARALRVPTINVSAMELTVELAANASVEAINAELARAAADELAGILGYTTEPLASCDFNHDPRSAIVDAAQTRVAGRQASLLVWFDNEWAYANRMLDVVARWLA